MNRKILLLILTIFISQSSVITATVRYVSKTGSSTPPYTTWATAADSIQKCIDICSFGDTIYVANGRYKEQIVAKRGLTFIGGGIDSCIIDTKDLCEPGFISVELKDSCIFKNFKVETCRISIGNFEGSGIAIGGIDHQFVTIEYNWVINAFWGIILNKTDGDVRHNIISSIHVGIDTEAADSDYYPFIDSNYISASERCIWVNFGMSPTIRGNILNLTGAQGEGLLTVVPGHVTFTNNIIISLGVHGDSGADLSVLPDVVINNVILGIFGVGIRTGDNDTLINNSVTCSNFGILGFAGTEHLIKYNNSWGNEVNFRDISVDSTNISYDPMYVNEDSLDLHLQKYSPLIDAGDPSILDVDGSRSDIGVFGGPYGKSYIYLDLPPKAPRNLDARLDSGKVKLTWDENTEADFSNYKVYRDTASNFTVDSTKIVAIADSSYFEEGMMSRRNIYYKITALDQSGNESLPSEEAAIIVVGVNQAEVKLRDYILYQNYPNPFNPTTTIGYVLRKAGRVRLVVYDIKGEIIIELENEWKKAGYYQKYLSLGNELASGIYLYRLEVKNENNIPVYLDMKKMVLVK